MKTSPEELVAALSVMVLDPQIKAFLEVNDPKALEQARTALRHVLSEAAVEAVRSYITQCWAEGSDAQAEGAAEALWHFGFACPERGTVA